MGPVGHSAISTVVGASVWGITGSPLAGAVAAGVGVLVDADHLVDLYQSSFRLKPNLVVVPLHGWEYSMAGMLVLCFAFYHPVFLAAIIGHLSHVATDHFHNRLTPLGYFVLYRAWLRFDARKIAPERGSAYFHHNVTSSFPFRGLWEPWYLRRIEPWLTARERSASNDGVFEQKK